jgi:GT2 family glycosyltransferase
MAMKDSAFLPVVSIVIVTWNGKRYALECLESIYMHPLSVPVEIIVVDNDSTDDTPVAIRKQFPNVRLVENQANLGFAKANNIGIALSRGKYVALINSDVVVYAGCLAKMLEVMEANCDIGIMGPKMICPDGSVGLSVMRLPTVWNTLCAALAVHSVLPNSQRLAGFSVRTDGTRGIEDVQVVTGWFWMTSRLALDQVGGLDERFFMFGEDIDWCQRFGKAGWRVVFCGNTESFHYGGGSSEEAPARYYVEMRRANLQYFQKHHGSLGAAGYRIAIAIHELARIAGYSVSYCLHRANRVSARSKVRRSVSCLQWLIGNHSLIARHAGE